MKYIYKQNENNQTVVFLHGWGGNKYSFASAFNFLFDYGYSVLSIDLSGFGENPKLDRVYTIFDYAQDVKILLESLKINSFYVVCHSFGNRITAILNTWFNIEKIVITGGAGLKERFGLKNFKILHYKFTKFLVKIKLVKPSNLSKFGSSDYKALDNLMKQTFINVVNQDLSKYFKKINGKVLLFWGKDDKSTPLYMAKKLKKLIKNSILVIENGGHFCYLENDFLFCNRVLNFFKGEV